jgi:hypothetical protein
MALVSRWEVVIFDFLTYEYTPQFTRIAACFDIICFSSRERAESRASDTGLISPHSAAETPASGTPELTRKSAALKFIRA